MVKRKFVVIGGAGAMGKITVTDLVKTAPEDVEIVVADYDFNRAKKLVEFFGDSRMSACVVDVRNRSSTLKAIEGATIVMNAVQYEYNLAVMEAALEARAHYVDLGGLFHMTRKQLALDHRFKAIGRLAVIGMGAAPGTTNILARWACDQLDTVSEIHCRVASIDQTKYEPKPALAVSYSLKTILEEFSFEPAVFTRGEFTFAKPMSGAVAHRFPRPIGLQKPMYTLHSEVATLPLSFSKKGVQEVSFKIAFDQEFTDRVRFLRDLGFGSHETITVGEQSVCPIDVVNKLAMSQPQVQQVGKLKQYEVIRSIAKGMRAGKRITLVADCHTAGMSEWGIGLDIDTGSPPSIAAQMIVGGGISKSGVLPPELCIPPDSYFKQLAGRAMKVRLMRQAGWKLKT